MGEAMYEWGQGVYVKSLHFTLSFAVSLKEEKIKKKKLGQPGTPFQVILIRALST